MISNNQDIRQVGAIMHLAIYSAAGVLGPWRDLGTIETPTPSIDATEMKVEDARSGKLVTVSKTAVRTVEKLTVKTVNTSLNNLCLVFGAEAVTTYSQSATPVTDIDHTVKAVDSILPLVDANGVPVYNIASVQSVKSTDGNTTYTSGTDYVTSEVGLKLGYITIPAGSTIPAGAVHVAYTPTAITSSKRLIAPHTMPIIKARVKFFYNEDNYAAVTVRDEVDAYLKVTGHEMPAENAANLTMEVELIDVTTSSSQPSGRVLKPIGSLTTFATP